MAVTHAFTTIAVSPSAASPVVGGVQQFVATAEDQFGDALPTQPKCTWTTTAGTISADGLLWAPATPVSNATVTAASGAISAAATFSASMPPTAQTPASANPSTVTGATTSLAALGADDGGEANLTYTWAAATLPSGATAPTFSANGTGAAKNTTATFSKAGAYTFTVLIRDAGGLTAASSVKVTVKQTLTAITVSPPKAGLSTRGTQQFAAIGSDQFGAALSPQPSFTWATTAGTISTSGLLKAPNTSVSNATVMALSGATKGVATFSASNPPTVQTAAAANPRTVAGTTTSLAVLGADDGGESNLTYTWAVTSLPNGATAPTFSVNGTSAAKKSTATLSKAGAYTFTVTIRDVTGLTTTSSVQVTVKQTLTAITVSPPTASISVGRTQQFTATAKDQFGVAMSPQPSFTWTTTVGTISTRGLLTAPSTSVSIGMVTATSGATNGAAALNVTQTNQSAAAGAMSSFIMASIYDLNVAGSAGDANTRKIVNPVDYALTFAGTWLGDR